MSPVAKEHRTHRSDDEKRAIIREWLSLAEREGSKREAAKQTGVGESLLRRWMRNPRIMKDMDAKAAVASSPANKANGKKPAKPKTLAGLRQYRDALGKTARELTEGTGASGTSITQLEKGRLAPNSAMLNILAPLYGLTAAEAGKMMLAPPMSAQALAVSQRRAGKPMPASAHRSREPYGPRNGNGNGVVLAERSSDGRRANTHKRPLVLKRMDEEHREELRVLTNTANVSAMKGLKEMTVPTEMVLTLLREYYVAIGIEGTIVLDPAAGRIFG